MRAMTMNQEISNGISRPYRRIYVSNFGRNVVQKGDVYHAMTVELQSKLNNQLQQQLYIIGYSDHKLDNEQRRIKYSQEFRLVQLLEQQILKRKKLRPIEDVGQMTQSRINFHQRMNVLSNKIKRAIQIYRRNKTLKLFQTAVHQVLERKAQISRRIFQTMQEIAIFRRIQQFKKHSHRMMTLVTNLQRKWRGKIGRRVARKYKYRLSVINEIVQTEEGYVKDLEIICYVLYKDAETILKKQKLEKLFINVQVILQYHKKLLQSLQKCMKKVKRDLGAVATVLKKYLPFFKIYFEYCKQAPYQQSFLKNLRRSNECFKEMLLISSKNPQLKGLNWESFLIKPVQRLSKYELLLKDLIRNTEDNHPSKGLYKSILEQIILLLQKNDLVMQQSIRSQKLYDLEEVFAEKIMEPWRRFISEQELIILIKEQLVKTIAYFLTGLILLTTDGGTKSLKAIKLNERSFCQPVLDNLNYRYLIRIKTQDDNTLIVLDNQQMRDDVQQLVQGLINDVREKCEERQSIIGDTSTNEQTITVTLKGTQRKKHGISEYTVYIVELINQGISQETQIRFREIKQLEETVRKKWPQMVLPELPSKTLRAETKVIENRKLAIEDYLTSLFNQFHLLKSEDQKQILVALHFDELTLTLDVETPDELKQSLQTRQSFTQTNFKRNLSRRGSKILPSEATKPLKIVVAYSKTIQIQCAASMKIFELYDNIVCEMNLESCNEFRFFETNSNLELLRMKPDEEKVFSDSGQSSLSLLSQTKTLIFRRVIFSLIETPENTNDLIIQLTGHQHFHDIKTMVLDFNETEYILITVLQLRFFEANATMDSIKKFIPKSMQKNLMTQEWIDRVITMSLDLVSTLDHRIQLINSHSDQAKQEYSDSISEKGKIGIILNHLVSQHPNFGVLFYDVTVSQETLKQIEQVGKLSLNSQTGTKLQLGLSFRGYHIINKQGKINFVIRYEESSIKVYSDQIHIFQSGIQLQFKTTQGYEIQLLVQIYTGNTT